MTAEEAIDIVWGTDKGRTPRPTREQALAEAQQRLADINALPASRMTSFDTLDRKTYTQVVAALKPQNA
jgi:hypothetical protein